jgi:hypothetical protein
VVPCAGAGAFPLIAVEEPQRRTGQADPAQGGVFDVDD